MCLGLEPGEMYFELCNTIWKYISELVKQEVRWTILRYLYTL